MNLDDSLIERYEDRIARESDASRHRKHGLGLFLTAIANRRSQATNSNIAVTGEPGIGKSTLSLSCAEVLSPAVFVDHPEDAVQKYVTFTASAFGRAIRDSPPGSIIIGDEFGQQMHHRKFMRDENISLSNVLQGFRFKEFISFMNMPGLRYIDLDAQGLLTWMANVDRRGHAQIYRVSHPKFTGSDFYQTFIDDYIFSKPHDALWKAYVDAKVTNQERVFEDSIQVMEKSERVPLTLDDMIKIIKETPDKYKRTWGGTLRFHAPTIEARFDIGHSVSSRLIAKLTSETSDATDSQL